VKPSTIRFRKAFGYSLVILLALYLLISLYLLFIPRAVFLNSKITQYYNWFALPGPYFRDDRIRVIRHLTISHKSEGGNWSEPRNVERENFVSYHDGIVYGKLRRSRYERFLAKSLNRLATDPESVQTKRPFKELHQYMKSRYLPDDVDSVRIVYQSESLDGDSIRTVFQLTYKAY
jgi:hypothetical protein